MVKVVGGCPRSDRRAVVRAAHRDGAEHRRVCNYIYNSKSINIIGRLRVEACVHERHLLQD
jgi:hypothetical protein